MSSHNGEDENVRFTGKNAEEAEDFIHAVNRHAWAAGKQRDYTWMADFAYACFTKKALRWYEDLDEETQNDWRLLKRAILTKYTTPPQSPSIIPSSASASASPTVSVGSAPAAPPPTSTTVQRGRIRMDHGGNGASTYIVIPGASKIAPGGNEIACRQAANVSDACVFEFDTIHRTITLQAGS
ncbi:hypothetical protein FS837_011576 [Tulasnella sp. UAMH 9824]|nr:hypothetical protein FS837_011576 [Tulasnella sp. UAMH 9824]